MEGFFGGYYVVFGGVFFPCINLHKYGQGEGIIKRAECIPFLFIKQNPLKMLVLHTWRRNQT